MVVVLLQPFYEKGSGEIMVAQENVHVHREARFSIDNDCQPTPNGVKRADGFQDIDDPAETLALF